MGPVIAKGIGMAKAALVRRMNSPSHLIDTTARPRTPHPDIGPILQVEHPLARLQSAWVRNAGVTNAVCPQAVQSTLMKSPSPRSSTLAAHSGTICRLSSPFVHSIITCGPRSQPGTNPRPYRQCGRDYCGFLELLEPDRQSVSVGTILKPSRPIDQHSGDPLEAEFEKRPIMDFEQPV